jgi:two-component system chemotaxis response regulator CheB
LPKILSWFGDLKVVHPKDGERIKAGLIYVAPPDHHMLVERNRVLVKKGPKENRFRPSIDALFRSAAYVYGPRVIGVVLTGMLNDGTSGLWSVKRLGGITIIQDPSDAEFPFMPQNVLEYVEVDYTIPLIQMGDLLTELTTQPVPEQPNITAEEMDYIEKEVVIAAHDNAFELGIMNMGELTPFTCPQCHGALISIKEGKMVRYRCHTGHAFTTTALLAGVTESVEETLWSSVRALEETYMLLKSIASQYKAVGNEEAAENFSKKAEEIRKRSRLIQQSMFTSDVLSEDILATQKNGNPIMGEPPKKAVPVKSKIGRRATQ